MFRYWRASDDFAIAAGYDARGVFPVAPYRVRDHVRRERDPRFVVFKQRLFTGIADKGLDPLRFWRTFPAVALSDDGRWLVASRFDDTGRALLLGMGFPVPILITTATALEAECFVLVHFLALGFVLEGVWARTHTNPSP